MYGSWELQLVSDYALMNRSTAYKESAKREFMYGLAKWLSLKFERIIGISEKVYGIDLHQHSTVSVEHIMFWRSLFVRFS